MLEMCQRKGSQRYPDIETRVATPARRTICKAVIFELDASESIVSWRDVTFFLLQDVCRTSQVTGMASKQGLLSYAPLEEYAQQKSRRITLASSVKPFIQSHYLKASLNVDPIFVSNGLHPRMNDSRCAKSFPPLLTLTKH